MGIDEGVPQPPLRVYPQQPKTSQQALPLKISTSLQQQWLGAETSTVRQQGNTEEHKCNSLSMEAKGSVSLSLNSRSTSFVSDTLNSVRYEEPCDTSSSTCAMCTIAFLKWAIKIEAHSKYISAQNSVCVCIQDWVPWGFCGSSVNSCKSSSHLQENVLGCISLSQSERTSEEF